MKIAINGMGRMGRLFLRVARERGLNVVACNEPSGTAASLALGIEFDSVHGRYDQPVAAAAAGEALQVGEHRIAFHQHSQIADLPWPDHGIDLVVECSGRVRTKAACLEHLERGAARVLVSNPVPEVPNIVYGVNHGSFDLSKEPVITAASCTTNCLAPVVRVLHDEIGIERGVVTTMHDPTNTQVVVDRPHKDPRRARSALLNLIPTSTNSATAVTLIVPELAGRLDSLAVRVPVLNASLTDCSFSMQRDTSIEEVHRVLAAAADGKMQGILGFETRPLVSSDYAHDARSGIVDAGCTRVVDRRLLKLMVWYDNEWGYVNRMADLVQHVAAGPSGKRA